MWAVEIVEFDDKLRLAGEILEQTEFWDPLWYCSKSPPESDLLSADWDGAEEEL